jgi:hypothetical protein
MEQTKALIESKTFWLAVLQAVIGAIAVFQAAYPDLNAVGWLVIAKSVLDAFLRAGSSAPISGIVARR